MDITKVNLLSYFFLLPQNPVWQASSFMIATSFFQTLPQKWFCHQTFSYLTLNLKHRLCLIPPFRILFLDSFFRTLCLSKKTNIFLVVYVFDNTPCSKQVCPRSARTAPHILYRSQHMLLCAFLLAGCQIFFLCALFVCTFFLTFSLVPIMLCALFNVMYLT